jgi:large-conductance mechanosensitive channel
MPVENLTLTPTDILSVLPENVVDKINTLIFISKIAVWIIIAYLVFLFIKSIFAWRRHRMIDKTYQMTKEINSKLDVLLKKKPVKEVTTKNVKKDSRNWFNKLFGF